MPEFWQNLQNNVSLGLFWAISSPWRGSERIYFLYLLTALLMALVSYLLYQKGKHSIEGFLKYCFPKGLYSHKSAQIDYWIFLLTPLIKIFTFTPFLISSVTVSNITQSLLKYFGAGDFFQPDFITKIIFTIVFFLAFDFAQYFSHFLMHKIWFLWEFHKIHHSAEVLIPFTEYRFHPLDILFTTSIIGLFTGLCQGIFNWVYIGELENIMVLGLHIGVFLFYSAAYNLRHTHIWLAYPGVLSYIFISPAQHQIHHSTSTKHWDKNFGFVLAIWDYVFKTLYVPKTREEFTYGLMGGEDKKYQNLANVFFLPFVNISKTIWQEIKNSLKKSSRS